MVRFFITRTSGKFQFIEIKINQKLDGSTAYNNVNSTVSGSKVVSVMLTSLTPQDVMVKRFISYCWKAIENQTSEVYRFLRKDALCHIPGALFFEAIPQPVNVIHLTDTEFIIGDICIPVYDSDLADVLKQLSMTQGDYLAFLFYTAGRSGDSFKYEADQKKVSYQKRKAMKQLRERFVGETCEE